jgi:hypothetical protein
MALLAGWLASYIAYDGWLVMLAILVGCDVMLAMIGGWLFWQTCMTIYAGWL